MEHNRPTLLLITKKRGVLVLGAILIISLCFIFSLKLLFAWTIEGIYNPYDNQVEESSFTNRTPEEIFLKYIWGSIPQEITRIEGVEGIVVFSEGPAFVRFEATNSFITELIEKEYNNYSSYSSSPCTIFSNISLYHDLFQNFPEKFKWWNPSEVSTPVCYIAQSYQDNASKYLLVDFDSETVYFYRTTTCGLCPD